MKETHKKAEYGIPGMEIIEDSDDRFYVIFKDALPYDGKHKSIVISSFLLALPASIATGFISIPIAVISFVSLFVGLMIIRKKRRPIAYLDMTADKLRLQYLKTDTSKYKISNKKRAPKYPVLIHKQSFDFADVGTFRIHKWHGWGIVTFDYGNTEGSFDQQIGFENAMKFHDMLNERRLKFLPPKQETNNPEQPTTRQRQRSAAF